jgi:hypothetical protein
MGFNAFGDAVELFDAGPSVREITSRKRPVPAAHLSFIRKSVRLPASSSWITLLSWPPISMTVRSAGQQPRAEPVARDLGDLLIGKIHQLATVAG